MHSLICVLLINVILNKVKVVLSTASEFCRIVLIVILLYHPLVVISSILVCTNLFLSSVDLSLHLGNLSCQSFISSSVVLELLILSSNFVCNRLEDLLDIINLLLVLILVEGDVRFSINSSLNIINLSLQGLDSCTKCCVTIRLFSNPLVIAFERSGLLKFCNITIEFCHSICISSFSISSEQFALLSSDRLLQCNQIIGSIENLVILKAIFRIVSVLDSSITECFLQFVNVFLVCSSCVQTVSSHVSIILILQLCDVSSQTGLLIAKGSSESSIDTCIKVTNTNNKVCLVTNCSTSSLRIFCIILKTFEKCFFIFERCWILISRCSSLSLSEFSLYRSKGFNHLVVSRCVCCVVINSSLNSGLATVSSCNEVVCNSYNCIVVFEVLIQFLGCFNISVCFLKCSRLCALSSNIVAHTADVSLHLCVLIVSNCECSIDILLSSSVFVSSQHVVDILQTCNSSLNLREFVSSNTCITLSNQILNILEGILLGVIAVACNFILSSFYFSYVLCLSWSPYIIINSCLNDILEGSEFIVDILCDIFSLFIERINIEYIWALCSSISFVLLLFQFSYLIWAAIECLIKFSCSFVYGCLNVFVSRAKLSTFLNGILISILSQLDSTLLGLVTHEALVTNLVVFSNLSNVSLRLTSLHVIDTSLDSSEVLSLSNRLTNLIVIFNSLGSSCEIYLDSIEFVEPFLNLRALVGSSNLSVCAVPQSLSLGVFLNLLVVLSKVSLCIIQNTSLIFIIIQLLSQSINVRFVCICISNSGSCIDTSSHSLFYVCKFCFITCDNSLIVCKSTVSSSCL